MSKVSVVQCNAYEAERVESAVREGIDSIGGMGRFVQAGQRVLLKPNLVHNLAISRAVSTHPSVVRAVVREVQAAGGSVVIGDSPVLTFTEGRLREVYAASGMNDVAAETGALLNFDVRAERVPFPDGRLMKYLDIARFALDADVIISLPKWKTHELMGFTGAIKNMFGLVPGLTKPLYHGQLPDVAQFATMLLDVLAFSRPAFSLLDGVVAMHGNGPSAGDPFPAGLILAGVDGVAVDLVAAYLSGLPLERVAILREAQRLSFTSGRIEGVEIAGPPLAPLRLAGFRPATSTPWETRRLPRFLRGLFIRQVATNPRVTDGCVRCGLCAQSCPMRAISCESRAEIDLRRCIRCYCCHEVCPHGAIALQRPPLSRLLR